MNSLCGHVRFEVAAKCFGAEIYEIAPLALARTQIRRTVVRKNSGEKFAPEALTLVP